MSEAKATVIAFANQKGGVGKTSMTINLADAWVRQGLRVLVVDVDPQAAATASLLGRDAEDGDLTLSDILRVDRAAAMAGIQAPAPWGLTTETGLGMGQRIDVIPSSLNLSDVWASASPGLVFRLRNALDVIAHEYDRILIDCPPDLWTGTVSAIVAAHYTVIPTRPELRSLAGVARTVETVGIIGRDMAPPSPRLPVSLAAIVPLAVDARVTEHKARLAELCETYGDLMTNSFLPHRLRSDEASGSGGPARSLLGNAGRVLGDCYAALAIELDSRMAATALAAR